MIRIGPGIVQPKVFPVQIEHAHQQNDQFVRGFVQERIQHARHLGGTVAEQHRQLRLILFGGGNKPAHDRHEGLDVVRLVASDAAGPAGGQFLQVYLRDRQFHVPAEDLGGIQIRKHFGKVLRRGEHIGALKQFVDARQAEHRDADLERLHERLDTVRKPAADEIIGNRGQVFAQPRHGRGKNRVQSRKNHAHDVGDHGIFVRAGRGGELLLRHNAGAADRIQKRDDHVFVAVAALDADDHVRAVFPGAEHRIQQVVERAEHGGKRGGKLPLPVHVPVGRKIPRVDQRLPVRVSARRGGDLRKARKAGSRSLRRNIHAKGLQRALIVCKAAVYAGQDLIERFVGVQRAVDLRFQAVAAAVVLHQTQHDFLKLRHGRLQRLAGRPVRQRHSGADRQYRSRTHDQQRQQQRRQPSGHSFHAFSSPPSANTGVKTASAVSVTQPRISSSVYGCP